MSKAERGRVFIKWIKAYIECLSEGRAMELLTVRHRARQLKLFH
jgi:hypothetical protein